jgi:hypothetical protein
MAFLRNHWSALVTIFLTGLFIYLQLLQWRKHGDDFMLAALNIIVTFSMWVILLIVVGAYWKRTAALKGTNNQIMRAGVLFSKAGQAEWLSKELEYGMSGITTTNHCSVRSAKTRYPT